MGKGRSAVYDEELCFDIGDSSIGQVLVATSERGVVAILVGDNPQELVDDLQSRFPSAFICHAPLDPKDLVRRVVKYVKAPCGILELPLDLRGTAFQQKVWNAVRAIPSGHTASYSEIASQIGKPRASRAVGSACARNNHAFAVPCHRVLHSDGSMSWGGAWGKDRQRQLLAREVAARPKPVSAKQAASAKRTASSARRKTKRRSPRP